MFTITKNEWKTARHYLRKEVDGTKLTYSAQKNEKGEVVPRMSLQNKKDKWFRKIERDKIKNPKLSQTFHSFIKLAGCVYGIAQGKAPDALLGTGQYGKVKFMIDSKGALHVVKIQDGNHELQFFEIDILEDRQLSEGRVQVIHFSHAQDNSASNNYGPKYAIHMKYLGMTIGKRLQESCSDETRLTMAIKLCLEVHDLHKIRSQSLSKTAYAHRDIKPDNATWDEKTGRVHLIDFGFAHDFPQRLRENDRGTAAYMPFKSSQGVSGEQLDVLALRRTLFLPISGYCSEGYFENFRKTDPNLCEGILSLELLKKLGLGHYIDTSSTKNQTIDFTKDNLSACSLAALLIAAKYQLDIAFEQLIRDRNQCLVICAMFNSNKEQIQQVLNDKRQTLITAAFSEMGYLTQILPYMQDLVFFEQMMAADSFEKACSLIHLKSQGLDFFYQQLENNEVIKALYVLIQQPTYLCNQSNTLSILEQPLLARAICVLERIQLQEHLKKLFNNKLLYETVGSIGLQDIKALHYLVSLFELGLSSNAIVIRFLAYERQEDTFQPFEYIHKKRSKHSIGLFTPPKIPNIIIENEALEFGDYGMYTF